MISLTCGTHVGHLRKLPRWRIVDSLLHCALATRKTQMVPWRPQSREHPLVARKCSRCFMLNSKVKSRVFNKKHLPLLKTFTFLIET